MKIAFFSNTILEHGGGLEKYFIEMSSALALMRPDFDISIITFNEERTEALQHILSFYYFKKMPVSNIYREKSEDILRKLGRVRYIKCASFGMVKKELKQYDVIYTKNELVDLGILKYFGYNCLPPIIVGAHTPIYFPHPLSNHDRLHNFLYNGWMYRFLLRGTAMVHVNNEDDVKLLRERFQYPSVRKIVLPFSFDKENVVENKHQSSEFHILFVGRLTAIKGIDIMLECIKRLSVKADFSLFKFRIVGSGELDFVEQFEKLSKKYANIEYLGHIPNSEINASYQWADVVLIPSRCETANYVALEAGSNSRIVIASDVSGPRESIVDGETGFLVPVDSKSFLEKIRYVYDLKKTDFEAFRQIGIKARLNVSEKFDPEAIYGQFQEMLVKITLKKRNNI